MASLKTKGDLAELKVAADLIERGYRVAIPFGEDNDFDLILCRGNKLERVQVKYTRSNGEVIAVKCYSDSLTNGRVRQTKRYTAATIDWLAVYDATTSRCFYIPASDLGSGRKRPPSPAPGGKELPAARDSICPRLQGTGNQTTAHELNQNGASGTRTRDLSDANRTLSQLSYGPRGG